MKYRLYTLCVALCLTIVCGACAFFAQRANTPVVQSVVAASFSVEDEVGVANAVSSHPDGEAAIEPYSVNARRTGSETNYLPKRFTVFCKKNPKFSFWGQQVPRAYYCSVSSADIQTPPFFITFRELII